MMFRSSLPALAVVCLLALTMHGRCTVIAQGTTAETVVSETQPTEGSETQPTEGSETQPTEGSETQPTEGSETQPTEPTSFAEHCSPPAIFARNPSVDFTNTQCVIPADACDGAMRDCSFKIGADGGSEGGCGKCESTLDGLKESVDGGANAIRLPVCMSQDNVPFVWHDCKIDDVRARARRMGQFLYGSCAPYVSPSGHRNSTDMLFADVQEHWGYRTHWTQCQKKEDAVIPKVEEVLNQFTRDDRVEGIVFTDLHDSDDSAAYKLAWLTTKMARCKGALAKMLYVVADPAKVPVVQCAVINAGGSARQVSLQMQLSISDFAPVETVTGALSAVEQGISQACQAGATEVPAMILFQVRMLTHNLLQQALASSTNPIKLAKMMKFMQPVKVASSMCIHSVFIGRPELPTGGELMKVVMMRALDRRRRNKPHLHIYATAIDSVKEMSWLMRHGADGLVARNPTKAFGAKEAITEAGLLLQADHCPVADGNQRATPAPGDNPAPVFVNVCLDRRGNPYSLTTFNKLLHCWATLLKKQAALLEQAGQLAQTEAGPGQPSTTAEEPQT